MAEIAAGLRLAFLLLIGFDGDLLRTVGLSLLVSVTATSIAALLGLPLGAVLAIFRFPGRRAAILLANALLGLPPVVVGLMLYLLLSRSGPFGALGLLFTPSAMILAQVLLALPIVTALSHRGMAVVWSRYGQDFLAIGLRRSQALPHVLAIGRVEALTAILAGFGRTISEVGAILIVGGNIAGYTRTMTTSIALETNQGHFAYALALGIILIAISLTVSAAAFFLSGGNRAHGDGP
jgi:tungstate transport system permease protein